MTRASDIFAFGVMAWEVRDQPRRADTWLTHSLSLLQLYSNTRPWLLDAATGSYRYHFSFPKLPQNAPRVFVDLVAGCLSYQPSERPSAADLVTALTSMHEAWLCGCDSLVKEPAWASGSGAGAKQQQQRQLEQLEQHLSTAGFTEAGTTGLEAIQSEAQRSVRPSPLSVFLHELEVGSTQDRPGAEGEGS